MKRPKKEDYMIKDPQIIELMGQVPDLIEYSIANSKYIDWLESGGENADRYLSEEVLDVLEEQVQNMRGSEMYEVNWQYNNGVLITGEQAKDILDYFGVEVNFKRG